MKKFLLTLCLLTAFMAVSVNDSFAKTSCNCPVSCQCKCEQNCSCGCKKEQTKCTCSKHQCKCTDNCSCKKQVKFRLFDKTKCNSSCDCKTDCGCKTK